MDAVIQEFKERVAEVDEYLKLLERLEDPNVAIIDVSTRRRIQVLKHGSLKVMKATVFLLVYNLVESAIRSAFDCLYQQIASEKRTVAHLRSELRRLWTGQQFDKLDRNSASLGNYRDVAHRLVDDIILQSLVVLSSDALPVSGNLDADAIRKVCRSHGVKVRTHHRAQGGQVLETVKKQRNALGHGNVSFSFCGQQYAVSDLKRIKQQSVVFVHSVLRNIKRYVEANDYAN